MVVVVVVVHKCIILCVVTRTKGFDEEGSVVCEAPEHVIENHRLRTKAGDDPKKLRKLKLKRPPDRGYAHWDESTFERLIAGDPERLALALAQLLVDATGEELSFAYLREAILADHALPWLCPVCRAVVPSLDTR